jgi:sugar O-acyltransferase (sialic acid O-acetyltransferase NeuD family)
MHRLIIIGAGGFGREVADVALCHPDRNRLWALAGFLDSRTHLAESGMLQAPLIGAPGQYRPQPEDRFVCAVDRPAQKKAYVELVRSAGGQFISLIHPEIDLSPSARIGDGCILYRYARIGPNAELGDHSCLGYCSGLGHDSTVGRFCQLSGLVSINGRCTVEDEVLIGASATIYPGKRVGARAVVGTGAVVISNVPAKVTVFGNPAKRLS